MKSTAKEIREESKALFLERFGGNTPLKLVYFHTFLCPVAFAEAMVKEHIVEDYDALELLVLRLYNAGFRTVKEMASLSGMKEVMIERALNNEINVYHHIDPEIGDLTDMGKKTFIENEINNSVNHISYTTPRRLQIEAVTGTVVPAYLEENNIKFLKTVLEEKADGVVPRESVIFDEELKREINDRLAEYKHMDILNEGDTIVGIESINTSQLYYRWAYLAKFEGMKYPMIVMQGKKTVEKVNSESIKKKDYGKRVAVPLAISRSDSILLDQNGMSFDDVLIRDDDSFKYLSDKIENFKFHEEQDDISLENENAVYEDERIMETIDESEFKPEEE